MALKVPIRFRGDVSKSGLEAERVFDITNWYVLHSRVDGSLKVVVARALGNLELSVIEWMVMNKIANCEDNEYTISQVADDFDMNMSQVTGLIKGLVKRGYVKTKVSLKDRRVKFLSCTRGGKKLIYDGDQAIQFAMRYWLFDLSDQEIVQYIETMKKISNFEIPNTSQN